MIGRRDWLKLQAGLGLGWVLGCESSGSRAVFTLGVASGDPLPDRVILWTRLLDPLVPFETDEVVAWEVATDDAFREVVSSGEVVATPASAHCVHVDAGGLQPGTTYFYRFRAAGETSPVGRTRTAPPPDAVTPLRLAVAACQDYRDGYYTAYADLVAQAPDLVAFLGDYVYENEGGGVRTHRGGEAVDLAGYRDRYAQYRSDPLLQAAHAWCPWIVTWDDHEVDNGWHGDTPEADAPVSGDAFLARRAAALQAFFEHMPIRTQLPGSTSRKLSWGRTAELLVGDARLFRDPRGCPELGSCTGPDGSPRLLGEAQESWLLDAIAGSEARHTLFVQSIMFTDVSFDSESFRNLDQWDGFDAERRRVLEAVRAAGLEGFAVLSGDRHAAMLAELHLVPNDASSPRLGWEVTCNSITSDGLPDRLEIGFKESWATLDWVRYAQARERGYVLLQLDEDGTDVIFRNVESVLEPDAPVREAMRFRVDRSGQIV